MLTIGVITPIEVAQAAVQSRSSSLQRAQEIYSILTSEIAKYSEKSNLGKSTILTKAESDPAKSPRLSSTSRQDMVMANQPIPQMFSESLIAKSSSSDLTREDPANAKLGFEPIVDINTVSEAIKSVVVNPENTNNLMTLNALTTIKPLNLLAMEIKSLNSKKETNLGSSSLKISSQLLENLESGLEAIPTISGLAPELPSLIARVYLPETSDYGLSTNFVWPAQGLLSSRFGWRWGRLHQGIDIAAPVGTPIWAAASGTVDFAGWNNGGYGNMVDILHPNGTISRYAHLSKIYVKRGQTVNQSQVIAAMGNTGFSTGPHLHFEIRPNGRSAMDPMTFLARVVSRG